MELYFINVTVHVLAALVWLGGIYFLSAVGAPVLRQVETPEVRARLFHALGARARSVGWAAIAVLVATGAVNLHFRGLLSRAALTDSSLWQTPYGHALAWKLATVGIMVGLQAVHDFVAGPRARRAQPGSAPARRWRSVAVWLARTVALVGVILVWAAVHLARGG